MTAAISSASESSSEKPAKPKLTPWGNDMLYVRRAARDLMEQIHAAALCNTPGNESIRQDWHQHLTLFFGTKEPPAAYFVELSNILLRYHEHDHARQGDAPPEASSSEPLTPEDIDILGQYLAGQER